MCKKADNWCREEKMGCKGCAYYNDNNGMTIKTKFKIGQKVWVLDVNRNAIDVFSTEINGIYINEDYKIHYYFREYCDDIEEENIVDYNDINTLYDRLKTLDKNIR